MEWLLGWDVVGRMAVAMVLGALIGLEREVRDHPAGLRTHAAVALGAAVFGVISTVGFSEIAAPRSETNLQADVTRVASQVVVGIGFLGAGLIFRRGGAVRNLTTAASLWVTAAVGLASGVGDPGVAVVGTLLMVGILAALRRPQRWLLSRTGRSRGRLQITVAEGGEPSDLRAAIEAADVRVDRWRTEKHDGRAVVEARVSARTAAQLDEGIGALVVAGGVHDLRLR